jgi:hypothetical protein
MGAVISTSFTWPMLDVEGRTGGFIILGIWYPALLLALGAIATASQQAVMLTRLRNYDDGPQRLRKMLGKLEGSSWRPRKLQLFVWQSPAMLQNASIYMFVVGLVVLIWKVAIDHWSTDQLKVCCSPYEDELTLKYHQIVLPFTAAFTFVFAVYVTTNIGLYHVPI